MTTPSVCFNMFAMTHLAPRNGASRWISTEESRSWVPKIDGLFTPVYGNYHVDLSTRRRIKTSKTRDLIVQNHELKYQHWWDNHLKVHTMRMIRGTNKSYYTVTPQ